MLGIDEKVLRWPLRKQILEVVLENCKKAAVKTLHTKAYFN